MDRQLGTVMAVALSATSMMGCNPCGDNEQKLREIPAAERETFDSNLHAAYEALYSSGKPDCDRARRAVLIMQATSDSWGEASQYGDMAAVSYVSKSRSTLARYKDLVRRDCSTARETTTTTTSTGATPAPAGTSTTRPSAPTTTPGASESPGHPAETTEIPPADTTEIPPAETTEIPPADTTPGPATSCPPGQVPAGETGACAPER